MTEKIDTRLWSAKIKKLTPYTPGEQPKHDNLCKLNTNENPYAPSPKAVSAMQAVLSNGANALRLYLSLNRTSCVGRWRIIMG